MSRVGWSDRLGSGGRVGLGVTGVCWSDRLGSGGRVGVGVTGVGWSDRLGSGGSVRLGVSTVGRLSGGSVRLGVSTVGRLSRGSVRLGVSTVGRLGRGSVRFGTTVGLSTVRSNFVAMSVSMVVSTMAVASMSMLVVSGLLVVGRNAEGSVAREGRVVRAGSILDVLSVKLLAPLVVFGLNCAVELLVFPGLGVDFVVGLAPSGVEVVTVRLVGPDVIAVSTLSSLVAVGGVRVAVVVVSVTVAVTVSILTVTMAVCIVLRSRGTTLLRGGSVSVRIDFPVRGHPLVIVSLVPLVVGLGVVGCGIGQGERLLSLSFLISSPALEFEALVARRVRTEGGGSS